MFYKTNFHAFKNVPKLYWFFSTQILQMQTLKSLFLQLLLLSSARHPYIEPSTTFFVNILILTRSPVMASVPDGNKSHQLLTMSHIYNSTQNDTFFTTGENSAFLEMQTQDWTHKDSPKAVNEDFLGSVESKLGIERFTSQINTTCTHTVDNQVSTKTLVVDKFDSKKGKSPSNKTRDHYETNLSNKSKARSFPSVALFSMEEAVSFTSKKAEQLDQALALKVTNDTAVTAGLVLANDIPSTSENDIISAGISEIKTSKPASPDHFSEELLSSVTCHQRCGENTSFPCSCDEKCVLYKTCCKDFLETCPSLHDLALTRFEHLLSASVQCDPILAVFVVHSCPLVPLENIELVNEEGSASQCPSLIDSPEQNQNEDETREAILTQILSHAPVTDYDTNIIFANSSIYECNKRHNSTSLNQTLSNPDGTWDTQLGILNQGDGVLNIDLEMYSYFPPKSHLKSAGSLCYPSKNILTCISNLYEQLNLSQTRTCNMSVNQYYKQRGDLAKLPLAQLTVTDDICAFCLANFQGKFIMDDRFFLSGFKVLASLSDFEGSVLYTLHEDSQKLPRPIPWLTWTCGIQQQISLQADKSCQVLHCDRRFMFTPEGLCRKAVEAEIRIQEEVLYKGKKCKLEPKALSGAIICYLQTFHKLKPSDQPLRIYELYSSDSNIKLIAIRMEMYFEEEKFEGSLLEIFANDFRFMTAIMLFSKNYCSIHTQNEEESATQTHKNFFSPAPKQEIHSDPKFTTEKRDISFLGIEDLKIKDMLNHFIFKICVQVNPINNSLLDEIHCDWYNDYKKDNTEYEVKINTLLSKVKDLKCLQEVGFLYESSGCKTWISQFILYLIAVTTIKLK